MKKILVCGAGGFIGSHLVRRLHQEGHWVRGVDLKLPEFSETVADDFVVGDLREQELCRKIFYDLLDYDNRHNRWYDRAKPYDEVYQLAADMGGAGYIFTGEHDADVMHNSAQINLNIADHCIKNKVGRVFYSSSACIYPEYNQLDPDNPNCSEESAYPADPDSEYGWEKLFSERMYLAYNRNHGLKVHIARFHNIFGPEGCWNNGKEKSPAALCRKVAETSSGDSIEVWGDGKQTRSFLYIDECLDGIQKMMASDFTGPVNIGSDEMIAINDLARMAIDISGKNLSINNIEGPLGVRGRNSDNVMIKEKLGWAPSQPLRVGIEKTYKWISEQVEVELKKQKMWPNIPPHHFTIADMTN